MSKLVKIQMTFQWECTEKEWLQLLAHRQGLKDNPKIILGDDAMHTFYLMRDLNVPEVIKINVE